MSVSRTGAPVRRHYLVNSCGVPALLDQAGRLRNSRKGSMLFTDIGRENFAVRHAHTRLAQCSPTTPYLICAARRLSGAPIAGARRES